MKKKQAPRCFLWVALNSEVGPELSPNFRDTTIWDETNANRRIGSNQCEAVSKELRIDILRLPTRNSEEPKSRSLPFIFSKKSFQLSVCLMMLYSCQYWFDTVSFQMIFEFAAPTAVIVNSVGSKLGPMIHNQLPQWIEPPIPFNHLIDY